MVHTHDRTARKFRSRRHPDYDDECSAHSFIQLKGESSDREYARLEGPLVRFRPTATIVHDVRTRCGADVSTRSHFASCLARGLARIYSAREKELASLLRDRQRLRSGVCRRIYQNSRLSLNLVDEKKSSHSQGPLARSRRTRSSFGLRLSGSGLAKEALPEYAQACGILANPRGHDSRFTIHGSRFTVRFMAHGTARSLIRFAVVAAI